MSAETPSRPRIPPSSPGFEPVRPGSGSERYGASISSDGTDGAQTVDTVDTEIRLGQVLIVAHELLSVFVDPTRFTSRHNALLALRPRPGDYERVFVSAAVNAARHGYEPLWQALPEVPFKEEHSRLRVAAALAEDFAEGVGPAAHQRAAAFPGGYEEIAQYLQPGVVWVSWELLEPEARDGLVFDGLVWLGGRWAWFPKPWRILGANR